jgi:hypothetical protein
MRAEPNKSGGFCDCAPAGRTISPFTFAQVCSREAFPVKKSTKPGFFSRPKNLLVDGCRRSASIIATRWLALSAENARLALIVYLPSPGTVDVTMTTFGGLSTSDICTPMRRARMLSAYRDNGFRYV